MIVFIIFINKLPTDQGLLSTDLYFCTLQNGTDLLMPSVDPDVVLISVHPYKISSFFLPGTCKTALSTHVTNFLPIFCVIRSSVTFTFSIRFTFWKLNVSVTYSFKILVSLLYLQNVCFVSIYDFNSLLHRINHSRFLLIYCSLVTRYSFIPFKVLVELLLRLIGYLWILINLTHLIQYS